MMENAPEWRRRAIEEVAAVSAKDVHLTKPVVSLLENVGYVPSFMHGVPLMT